MKLKFGTFLYELDEPIGVCRSVELISPDGNTLGMLAPINPLEIARLRGRHGGTNVGVPRAFCLRAMKREADGSLSSVIDELGPANEIQVHPIPDRYYVLRINYYPPGSVQ